MKLRFMEILERVPSKIRDTFYQYPLEKRDELRRSADEMERLPDQVRPFVFDGILNAAQLGDSADELCLPFQTCAFEIIGAPIAVWRDGTILNAVVVHEVAPKTHLFVTHETLPGGRSAFMSHIEYENDLGDNSVKPHILRLLYALRTARLATEKATALRVRVGSGNDRRLVKIKQIIRVVPKSVRAEVRPIAGGRIDWSHRWEVMGHWRKCSGIGKDREGRYVIVGNTWVTPHTKGAEGLPVTPKTRMVIAS